jgi:hypothetical protein
VRLLHRAVDGVQIDSGVVGVRRAAAATGLKAPNPMTAYEVGFAPAVPDPQWLDLRTWVKGDIRQDSNTDKVFSAPASVNPT